MRKKTVSLLLSLVMCLGLLTPAARAAEITVTEMLEPKYDDMQAFSEGLAPVCLNIGGVKRWGYIDTTGLEAITLTDASGGGFTYFKLRDLGTALGFLVDWNAVDGIVIKTR